MSRHPSICKADIPTVQCKVCNRFFTEDRITKHEKVCSRNSTKARSVFDASRHRVKGTEAEKYYKPPTTTNSVCASTSTQPRISTNWRKNHEDFIAAIKAAREAQEHIARGGKFSELPPPTPTENLDYIQCPHCLRRFNETAANRHIPKCANMIHNKPKKR